MSADLDEIRRALHDVAKATARLNAAFKLHQSSYRELMEDRRDGLLFVVDRIQHDVNRLRADVDNLQALTNDTQKGEKQRLSDVGKFWMGAVISILIAMTGAFAAFLLGRL